MDCTGRVNVQDYIPRNFSISFGFHCDWPRVNSLQGLKYNISFTEQSNDTNGCTDYSIIESTEECSRFYHHTSVPSMIGNEHVDSIANYLKQSMIFEALIFKDGICCQHFWKVACHTILPKCDPVSRQVIHPCKEMCWEFLNGCWHKWLHLFGGMGSEFKF